MLKKILFFPGYLIIAIIYFLPTETGLGRNTIIGSRWWINREIIAPILSICLYIILVFILFTDYM